MISTTGRHVVVEPVSELPSSVVVVPNRTSRWKNGNISICGKIVALGRKNVGLELGQYVYHSDSCATPINDGKFNVLHENDVMFMSNELIPVQWIGAKENFDDA